jgi:NDP-sugar pyrophosphorylase family protein
MEMRVKGMPDQAVILAAGRGTRLGTLGDERPKSMLPVAGKPILQHTVEAMSRFGVRHIAINLCHRPEVIMNHLGDGGMWGVDIRYSLEDEPLGTAGGVKKAVRHFKGPFFVWYGDNLSTCNLARLYSFHSVRGGIGSVALHRHPNPTVASIVELDEDERIVRFHEKPRPEELFAGWANAAIYLLEPAVLAAIPDEGTPDFGRDIFPALLRQRERLYGYRLLGNEDLWWIDTPQDLERVQRLMTSGFPPQAQG